MAQFQYQEQEELSLDDFDKSNEVTKSRRSIRKNEPADEALWASLEARSGEVYSRDMAMEDLPVSKVEPMYESEQESLNEDEGYEYLEFIDSDSDYPWRGLTEAVLALGSRVPEWLLKVDIEESAEKLVDQVEFFIEDLPIHETELKLIMSLCMICYGGSWPRLASYIAAFEVFGTEKVLDEVVLVGRCLYNSCCNYEVTTEKSVPTKTDGKEIFARVRQTIKDAGLQIAVLLAVLHVAPWAEVCLSIAFASKISGIVRLQEVFTYTLRTNDYESSVSPIEAEWSKLLSTLCCNILALVLFSVGYPSLIIAMYMAHLGLEMILCDDANKTLCIYGIPLMFARGDWEDKAIQNYVWATIAVMSLWQALSGYSGLLEPISWLMLLFPTVKLYNMVYFNASKKDVKEE